MSGKSLVVSESLKAASEKLAAVIGVNPLLPVFQKAEVVIAVRDWLQHPEVIDKVKQLQNTPSGFQTDEKGGYDEKTLALCVTDALCAGFNLVGNEFNIIGGRMMGVLNGYHRKVDEFENAKTKMEFKEVLEGDITVNGNMVKIPMTVKYTLLNKETLVKSEHVFARTIQLVKRYDKEGPDAWIGKATRRVLKKLFVNLTGNDLGDDLGDEGSVVHGGSQAATAAGMPPTGKVDLADKKPAKGAPEAQDADWSPVDAGAPAKPAEPAAAKGKAKPDPIPAAPPPKDVF